MDCVEHAFNAYLRRASKDTNPSIVQLLFPDGKPDSHWYYKSDQVVSTSAFEWPEFFPEYEGHVDEIPKAVRRHFLPDRFVVNDFLTQIAERSPKEYSKDYEEALSRGFRF